VKSEAIEKWEGKDLFSPLATKSGRAFVLPSLQLVPPLKYINVTDRQMDISRTPADS